MVLSTEKAGYGKPYLSVLKCDIQRLLVTAGAFKPYHVCVKRKLADDADYRASTAGASVCDIALFRLKYHIVFLCYLF
jgi:hypothetical protein